jgi:hypothetical protein
MDIDRFIQALRAQEGAPFHHQGRTAAGVDCAGLVLAGTALPFLGARVRRGDSGVA